MSWDDDDELERGGACNECGAPVEEEHHAYCRACFAEQNGWNVRPDPPDRDALAWQRQDREQRVTSLMIARLDDLERRLDEPRAHRMRGNRRMTEPLLDANGAAELLNVPASWVLAEARANRIPHIRLGRYVRFDADELRDVV